MRVLNPYPLRISTVKRVFCIGSSTCVSVKYEAVCVVVDFDGYVVFVVDVVDYPFGCA